MAVLTLQNPHVPVETDKVKKFANFLVCPIHLKMKVNQDQVLANDFDSSSFLSLAQP